LHLSFHSNLKNSPPQSFYYTPFPALQINAGDDPDILDDIPILFTKGLRNANDLGNFLKEVLLWPQVHN